MSLSMFFRENAIKPENRKVVISNRFLDEDKPIQWELQAVTEEENQKLKNLCTVKILGKGKQVTQFDSNRYTKLLVAASVVYPDLKDAELQKSYGILGVEALLGALLTAGEFANLSLAAQELSGFDAELEEEKKEIKNS